MVSVRPGVYLQEDLVSNNCLRQGHLKVYRIESVSVGEDLRNIYPWYYGRAGYWPVPNQTKYQVVVMKSAELRSVSSQLIPKDANITIGRKTET